MSSITERFTQRIDDMQVGEQIIFLRSNENADIIQQAVDSLAPRTYTVVADDTNLQTIVVRLT